MITFMMLLERPTVVLQASYRHCILLIGSGVPVTTRKTQPPNSTCAAASPPTNASSSPSAFPSTRRTPPRPSSPSPTVPRLDLKPLVATKGSFHRHRRSSSQLLVVSQPSSAPLSSPCRFRIPPDGERLRRSRLHLRKDSLQLPTTRPSKGSSVVAANPSHDACVRLFCGPGGIRRWYVPVLHRILYQPHKRIKLTASDLQRPSWPWPPSGSLTGSHTPSRLPPATLSKNTSVYTKAVLHLKIRHADPTLTSPCVSTASDTSAPCGAPSVSWRASPLFCVSLALSRSWSSWEAASTSARLAGPSLVPC